MVIRGPTKSASGIPRRVHLIHILSRFISKQVSPAARITLRGDTWGDTIASKVLDRT